MVKTFENLLLKNQTANYLGTWYAALGTQALPNLFKWWPLVDHVLFYNMVKFDNLDFCMGKRQAVDFSEAVVAYDIKVDICNQLNDFFISTKGQGHL